MGCPIRFDVIVMVSPIDCSVSECIMFSIQLVLGNVSVLKTPFDRFVTIIFL